MYGKFREILNYFKGFAQDNLHEKEIARTEPVDLQISI